MRGSSHQWTVDGRDQDQTDPLFTSKWIIYVRRCKILCSSVEKTGSRKKRVGKEAENYISHSVNYYVIVENSNNTPKSSIDEAGVNANIGMPCLQEVWIRMI